MEDIFYPSADGKHTVHAVVWRPEGKARAVVQIIHGMCEYIARYSPFAEFLASNGFLVCGEDHLGHGKTAKNENELGYFDDGHNYKTVLADIHALREKMDEGLPYFVMGHSMGSFFCRNYIALHGKGLAGAIVMGTGFKGKCLLKTAKFMVRTNALFCGWDNRSKFIKNLAFGSYGKKFKEEDENSWLSVDGGNKKAYADDPLCGFKFTNNGYYVLFSAIEGACSKKIIRSVPKDLPVLFVAGADDPVGDYGKGVEKAFKKFKKAGVNDVQIKLYDGARHEILNDFCAEETRGDILEFLLSKI